MRYRMVGRTWIFAWIVASACLAFPSGPARAADAAGRDAAVVEGPAATLQVARGLSESRERLAAALEAGGRRLLLLSRTNFLRLLILPLRREGRLDECVVVLPADDALTEGKVGVLLEAMKYDGVSDADRAGFTIDNGTFRGRIEGMPVVFATLGTLPAGNGVPRVVAIEDAFFQDMRNEVRSPVTALVRKLNSTMHARHVASTGMVLLDTSDRPDSPLEDGYLTLLFREALSSPALFAERLPPKWEAFAAGELARYFAQYPEAFDAYRRFLEAQPDEASTCFKIAMMAIRDLDVPFALQWINRAAAADPRYRRGFAELAAYLFGKDMFDPAERVIRAGLARFPKDPVLATGLANFHIARGEAARESGDSELAAANFRSAAEVEGADREAREKANRLLKAIPEPEAGE